MMTMTFVMLIMRLILMIMVMIMIMMMMNMMTKIIFTISKENFHVKSFRFCMILDLENTYFLIHFVDETIIDDE